MGNSYLIAKSQQLNQFVMPALNFTYQESHLTNGSFSPALGRRNTIDEFLSQDLVDIFMRQNLHAKKYDDVTQAAIITSFVILMMFGAVGNSLVCWVVISNPKMRTQRNIFVVNLAISDLTLCVFTQLFNLYKVLTTEWKLGEAMCKFVSMFSATNVFVSTASITAIALDRFQVIVYPTRQSRTNSVKLLSFSYLLIIWLVSLLMASPLAVFSTLHQANFSRNLVIEYCLENNNMINQRKIYSIALLLIQYVLPIVTVCVAHARISHKLKYRLVSSTPQPGADSIHRQSKSKSSSRRHTEVSQPSHDDEGHKTGCCRKKFKGAKRSSRKVDCNGKFETSQTRMALQKDTTNKSGQPVQSLMLSDMGKTNADENMIESNSAKNDAFAKLDNLKNIVAEPFTIQTDRQSKSQSTCDPNDTTNVSPQISVERKGSGQSSSEMKSSAIDTEMGKTNLEPIVVPASQTGESNASIFMANKRKREARRKRRTNTLLVLIAVIFAASWMPLNLANILVDFQGNLIKSLEMHINGLLFPICHLIVLCSACINPLLYGWLNDNFRREFMRVLSCSSLVHALAPRFACCSRCAQALEGGSVYCCCGYSVCCSESEDLDIRGGCCPCRRRHVFDGRSAGDENGRGRRAKAIITSCPSATLELTSKRSSRL